MLLHPCNRDGFYLKRLKLKYLFWNLKKKKISCYIQQFRRNYFLLSSIMRFFPQSTDSNLVNSFFSIHSKSHMCYGFDNSYVKVMLPRNRMLLTTFKFSHSFQWISFISIEPFVHRTFSNLITYCSTSLSERTKLYILKSLPRFQH